MGKLLLSWMVLNSREHPRRLFCWQMWKFPASLMATPWYPSRYWSWLLPSFTYKTPQRRRVATQKRDQTWFLFSRGEVFLNFPKFRKTWSVQRQRPGVRGFDLGKEGLSRLCFFCVDSQMTFKCWNVVSLNIAVKLMYLIWKTRDVDMNTDKLDA